MSDSGEAADRTTAPIHLALPLLPAEVAERIGVAHAGEGERRLAVGFMAASRPFEFGLFIAHVVIEAELHATDGVDDAHNATHTDLHEVIDRDAREPFDRLHEERCTAKEVRRVQLVCAVTGDLHICVTWERDH